MAHQSYEMVLCAGISAVKWLANKEPQRDKESIESLKNILQTISAKRFILISTIDVYPVMRHLDENFDCACMDNHPYGKHRLAFELFCKATFSDCYIVRLPALFGDGLKKNVIYDFLNDNCLEMINIKSSYQYYYLKNLWKDIGIALENDIRLINLFTEPITTKEIHDQFFSTKKVGENAVPEGHYDLYTRHASLWGKSGNYIYTRDEVMGQLQEFIDSYS